jgi:hypothetical protein
MTVPHQFPSLLEGPAQVVIVAGTGLSTPDAPTVDRLKGDLTAIAASLGSSIVLPEDDADYFYVLAESVLAELEKDGAKTASESRLWLAEKLGMLDDRRWFGEIGLPLSGNTPRHRAIARFAVEKRLRAVVSLNWDTLLESALDSVGLTETPALPRPWELRAHARVIEDADKTRLGGTYVFPVIKPHGCVRNLEQARQQVRLTGVPPTSLIFKLTKTELNELKPEQHSLVDEKVQAYVSECPLLAVGWKASEKYLRDAVSDVAKKTVCRTEQDALTVVNRSWYPSGEKTDTFHEEIASAYGKTAAEAFVAVAKDGCPSTDQLFLWLQARYAVLRLEAACSEPQKTALQDLLAQLDQPVGGSPILSWVDRWLPTWTRLCWRAGVVQGTDPHTGRTIQPSDIPVTPRDVHVPLGGMNVVRRDLAAAGKLLTIMSGALGRFDYEMLPGGMWDAANGCLYLPLPGWRGATEAADLAALKPHVEAMRSWGFVRELKLVWVDTEDTTPDQTRCEQLEAQVRRLMPLAKFATRSEPVWVGIDTLKGDGHASVA